MAAVLCALVVAAAGKRAQAQANDPVEEDLLKRGVESRKQGDDAAALELFRRALDRHASPRALAQVGLAEVALGQWVNAEGHLDAAVGASSDPWIKKNSATLLSTLAKVREKLGSLQVLGEPAGAEITIEGEVRGKVGSKPIRVRSGDCQFEVRAPGYASLRRVVEILPESLTRETVNLSRTAVAAGPGPSPSPSPAPAVQENLVTTEAPPAPAPGAEPDRRLRIASFVLAGAGAAVAITGIAFGIKARSLADKNSSATVFDPDAESAGHRYQTLQYVGYGLGGALIAAGVTTFFLSRPKTGATHEQKVSLVVYPGGSVASFELIF
ncbi:MAG TPA: hypothetical protein VNO55_18320 [Polyangia bacterium]|nr:hypothetical protein [Polyangia bacterium]